MNGRSIKKNFFLLLWLTVLALKAREIGVDKRSNVGEDEEEEEQVIWMGRMNE